MYPKSLSQLKIILHIGNSLWHPGAPAPGLHFDFSNFQNASEKSEKIWAQTYASVEHSWNFLIENNNFSALCKKRQISDKKHTFLDLRFCQKFVFFVQSRTIVIFCQKISRVFDTCVCLCPIFLDFSKAFSYFLNFKNKTGCRCTRAPKRLSLSIYIYGKCFLLPGVATPMSKYHRTEVYVILYRFEYVHILYPRYFIPSYVKKLKLGM